VKTSASRRQSAADPAANGRAAIKRGQRSRVTNGSALHVVTAGDNAWNRRFRDLVGSIVSDLGGDPDQLSEGQRQLCRRAAGLSLECEKLEAQACGAPSAAEEAFRQNVGGLSSREILGECARIIHMVARIKGDGGPRQMAAMERPQLDHVVDLLVKAGDIASKAANAGAETAINVERYGTLCDRLGRVFGRLGLERRQREVESLSSYLAHREAELPEEPLEEAAGTADVVSGLSDSGSGNGRVSGHARPGAAYRTGEESSADLRSTLGGEESDAP
jgi:hypothetical protein